MKFVRDKAHCRHEGYVKEDYVIIEKTITVTANSEEGAITIPFPTGFSFANTTVMNYYYSTSEKSKIYAPSLFVSLSSTTTQGDVINVTYRPGNTSDEARTISVAVVLMKIA